MATKKAPRDPSRDPSESAIQRAIVDLLRYQGLLVIRINSGMARAMRTESIVHLAPQGTPDLLVLFPEGKVLWIEVKTRTGRIRPDQVQMHDRLRSLGHDVVILRSADELVELMKGRGYFTGVLI
jgi:hypothetical protein